VVAENNTGRMLRSDHYKYCVYTSGKIRESLIDLQADPGEMKNLAGLPKFHKELNQHRGYLKKWIKESKDITAKAFAIEPN
jgi:arylsulfatase A-like enzyme